MQSFSSLFYLLVKDDEVKRFRSLIISKDALIFVGIVSSLTRFVSLTENTKTYFIVSILAAIVANPLVLAAKVRNGPFIVARYLVLIGYSFIGYAVAALLPLEFFGYFAAFVVLGLFHLSQVYPNFLFIRNFWRLNHNFGLFTCFAYTISHGSALFVYIMALIRGGF